ncbi:hypothetical protein VP1G_06626 [Cytospora mali]|uniref:Heat shock 70 kDa protein 12B n=1 Tax=Cytospora mali TaxID=578113 RepID=A0A194V673_CYTMA|nr:hypothetical protein VP1G_06626 [Valsa mali var. pyri (nom. inval.)]
MGEKDFGSTATRACIVVTETNSTTEERDVVQVYYVQERRAKHRPESRFERGEYPSMGCPFDGPPFYVGFDAVNQSAKTVISLKSIPYFRTLENDEHPFTAALYDHYNSLSSEEAKEVFKKTLDDMLLAFFTSIVNGIIDKSESRVGGFKLLKLSLCVPNTWSTRENHIQHYLGNLLDRTVAGHHVETLFVFEAQAQAQFMIHRYPEELTIYDYLMVLDFGGHSMGGSHGYLRWCNGRRPIFFSPPDSDFGVRGGYELWEILIGQVLDQERTHQNKDERIPEEHWQVVRAALLKEFFLQKTKDDYKNRRQLTVKLNEILGSSTLGKEPCYMITIPGERVNDTWEKAFRDIINMAKKNISRIAKTDRDILVLLTGGSIENVRARDEIMGFCKRFQYRSTPVNIDCRHVSDEIDVMSMKWFIAEGGARCLAATMNVEDFFNQGGALALQMSTNGGKWTLDYGTLFFYKVCNFSAEGGDERKFAIEITISANKKFRIIADPLYGQSKKVGNKVFIEDCYDIWDMSLEYETTAGAGSTSQIPEGRYILEVVKMVYDGADAGLMLSLGRVGREQSSHRPKRTKVNSTAFDEGRSLLLEVPLASNGSNNLVEIDWDCLENRIWRFGEKSDDAVPGVGDEQGEG